MSSCARARARHPWRMPCSPPNGPLGSACTFASTNAAQGSSRSGLASGSGRPVVVVTTSGTAVVNLHPAVLEAHHAGLPLVVVSADRPHELRGTGANQTTLQPGRVRRGDPVCRGPPGAGGAPGARALLAEHGVPRARGSDGVGRAPLRGRCTSTSVSASRSCPTTRPPAWPDALDGPAGRWTVGPHGRRASSGAEPVVDGLAACRAHPRRRRAHAGPRARRARGRVGGRAGSPRRRRAVRQRRIGAGERAAPRAAAPHGHGLARGARARTGSSSSAGRRCPARSARCCDGPGCASRWSSEGGQWPDPSHVASAGAPAASLRAAAAARTTPPAATAGGAGLAPCRRDGSRMPLPHSGFPWPSGLGVASDPRRRAARGRGARRRLAQPGA